HVRDPEPEPILLQARDLAAHRAYSLRGRRHARSPRGPTDKLPFIEDAALRLGDTSRIVDYSAKTSGLDLYRHLNASKRGIALLVQRTLEEHYAFVTLYTHFIRADGWRYTRASFDSVPTVARALVASMARGRMRKILWMQGVLRHSDEEIIESAV